MADPNVLAPYGFNLVEGLASGNVNFPTRTIAYTANINRALAVGDFINIGAGALGIPSATPTTTRNGNSPWGLVTAITVRRSPVYSPLSSVNFIPANAITAGYSGIEITYIDSPHVIMSIQADGNANAATAIGKNAPLIMTAATNVNGLGKSNIALDDSDIATTNTLAVRIIGFANGSKATDLFPEYLVIWTPGVHAHTNVLGV